MKNGPKIFKNTLVLISLLIIAAAMTFSWRPAPVFSQGSSPIHVDLQVSNCNNNGICEPQFGENYPSCPLECSASTSTPPGGGGVSPPIVVGGYGGSTIPSAIIPNSISIQVTAHSAIISWSTYGETIGFLSWGLTAEVELGTIAEINYGLNHQIELDGLDSATRYFFKIESRGRNGASSFLGILSFVTLSGNSIPLNPSNFHFTITASGALLSWQNPVDRNFQEVRLLRSGNFYPPNPNSGHILYEGPGTSFLDNSIQAGGNYYYTLFARNTDGAYSSGAILHLRLLQNGVDQNRGAGRVGAPAPDNIPARDINIEQNQKSILSTNNNFILVVGEPFIFSYFFTGQFSGAQSFVLSIEDEDAPGVYHSYLLQRNGNSSTLEANIPSFSKSGNYRFFLDVINGSAEGNLHFSGTFEVRNPPSLSLLSFWQKIVAYIMAFLRILARFLRLF